MSDSEQVPVEELVTLEMISKEFEIPLDTVRRWADVDRVVTNNFPEVRERIGNVKFFKRSEVERWISLWKMTRKSNNFKEGTDGQRSQGV